MKVEDLRPADAVSAELRRVSVVGDFHDMPMNVMVMGWEKCDSA